MGLLSDRELCIVKLLRERGIFEDISWQEFQKNHEAILVLCPDCDQPEQEEYHLTNTARIYGSTRIQGLKYNGGTLNIDPRSPLNAELPRGAVLIEDIVETIAMKNINHLGLYSHYPCGKGFKHGISLTRNLDLSIGGKQYLRNVLPHDIVIGCFFYVYPEKGMGHTYFVNRIRWEEWREEFFAMDIPKTAKATE